MDYDEKTVQYFHVMGYAMVRQLPDGRWIGVSRFLYTAGLCVGLGPSKYEYRYCYARYIDAIRAAEQWDGHDDPPGPWIKLKGHLTRGEVLGPGATE